MQARDVLKSQQRDVYKRLRLQLGCFAKRDLFNQRVESTQWLIEVVNQLVHTYHKALMNTPLFLALEA